MSSKKQVELQAAADKAVAKWRELASIVDAKETELAAFRKAHPLPPHTFGPGGTIDTVSEVLIDHLEREAVLHDARGAAAQAEREACLALDALEVAEGMPDAVARDLPTLRHDLEALYGEVDAARAALDAACRRLNDRAAVGVAAVSAAAARRQKAGLPFAHAGFNPRPFVSGPAVHRPLLADIDAAVQRGFQVPGHAAAAANKRTEIRRAAALLEQRRREKAEEEREIAMLRKQREQEAKESDRRMRQRAEDDRRAEAEERAARERDADAYLARRTGAAQ